MQSLVDALQHDDEAELLEILAPDGATILSSGDDVADRVAVEQFLARFEEGHQISKGADGTHTLLVGHDDWPLPMPIVGHGKGFVFDTRAGRDEIVNRRIGRNELSAQQVCLAIVDAQREYVALRPMGGELPQYARKLVSDPGMKDGLYWPTPDGEPPSPLGPLAASAAVEPYRSLPNEDNEPRPYYGYRYRLLTSQGAHARGGELDYVMHGKLVGGFAVVAYPAQYGNSGVMTFMTNHDGVLYERDLGPKTARIVESMTAFDPEPGWVKSSPMDGAVTASTE